MDIKQTHVTHIQRFFTSLSHMPQSIATVIGCCVVACALIIASQGFSDQGRYVEVKGLSEKTMKADMATWTFSFDVKAGTSEELANMYAQQTKSVMSILTSQGFQATDVSFLPATYQDTYSGSLYRYNGTVNVTVFSHNVDLVKQVATNTTRFFEKGIPLSTQSVVYEIQNINTFKQAMLKEAISHARTSAKEFAHDSGARLGGIARANQGVIEINDQDIANPEIKKIRLVTTVRYILK